MTATATPEVRVDIKKSLNMRNPDEIVTSFDRKNLFLAVRKKTNSIVDDIKTQARDDVEGSRFNQVKTKSEIIFDTIEIDWNGNREAN